MNSSCERQPTPYIMIASKNMCLQLVIFLCIVNSVTALVSTTGNFLVVVTIWRTPSLHSPSFVLLSGLALSDLAVGLIAQPIFVVLNSADIYDNCDLFSVLYRVHPYLSSQLLVVTFATVCATAVDRFLALKIHLRYRELVTVRRALFCLLSIWLTSTILALWILLHHPTGVIGGITLVVVVLFITVTCYVKIFHIVRHHQNQIANQFQVPQSCVQTSVPNIARYRKSVRSLLYIAGFFCVSNMFWVFWVIAKYLMNSNYEDEMELVMRILVSLSYLNSCFNPFLYCWRIGEIRQAMKEQLKKMC